ncbi:hypothetical protein [Paenibacillus qinlingensis]|uniref:hypothetical protein n=1 Tax=Paenibacillus qinlingensis TaxID=1837343 RepID=UPI0015656FC2|nr:hypothetical protein [Paenibacillus qinlingensis]NQX63555.1 hypothetical protein [Paenibacillus qinlingensis]
MDITKVQEKGIQPKPKTEKNLKSALVEAAHSFAASKNYLGAMYRRTAARKGKKRAAVNVAHDM